MVSERERFPMIIKSIGDGTRLDLIANSCLDAVANIMETAEKGVRLHTVTARINVHLEHKTDKLRHWPYLQGGEYKKL